MLFYLLAHEILYQKSSAFSFSAGKIKAPRKSSVPKKISEQEESKISAESSTATTVMFTNHSDITASKSLAQSTSTIGVGKINTGFNVDAICCNVFMFFISVVNISNTSKTCKTVSKPVVIDIEKEPVSSTVTIKVLKVSYVLKCTVLLHRSTNCLFLGF